MRSDDKSEYGSVHKEVLIVLPVVCPEPNYDLDK